MTVYEYYCCDCDRVREMLYNSPMDVVDVIMCECNGFSRRILRGFSARTDSSGGSNKP